ncbi:hypothetical protein L208DRAFT_1378748 [Tricholoma matsutake]|nr:hypothetical protein L208DRAFT_1380195 [Tricholoma matsutake 945]KAF8229772.1 hypothetical protein L208DRAFT_1378748 [Tricholoma matsutake 945]
MPTSSSSPPSPSSTFAPSSDQQSSAAPLSDQQVHCQKIYDELMNNLQRQLPKSKKEQKKVPEIKGEQLGQFEHAACLIPCVIDMFAPIHSIIEAGLLNDGVWMHEDNNDDDEGTEDEESRTDRGLYIYGTG